MCKVHIAARAAAQQAHDAELVEFLGWTPFGVQEAHDPAGVHDGHRLAPSAREALSYMPPGIFDLSSAQWARGLSTSLSNTGRNATDATLTLRRYRTSQVRGIHGALPTGGATPYLLSLQLTRPHPRAHGTHACLLYT